jgi:hypothetical protein
VDDCKVKKGRECTLRQTIVRGPVTAATPGFEHALILKKAIDLRSRWFPIFNRARVQFSLLAGIMMPYNTDASTITTLQTKTMKAQMTTKPYDLDPWDMIQPRDLRRMGEIVGDRKEQVRWSRAVMLAGALPYMWRHKPAVMRAFMYDRLDLRKGDRVLILGFSARSSKGRGSQTTSATGSVRRAKSASSISPMRLATPISTTGADPGASSQRGATITRATSPTNILIASLFCRRCSTRTIGARPERNCCGS